jgi:hypothetical protein
MRAAALVLSLLFGCTRAPAGPRLDAVGPRVVSNQTSYPLAIWGDGFTDGLVLELELNPPLRLPTRRLDARHLAARLPGGVRLPPDVAAERVRTRLLDAGGVALPGESWVKIVNDTAFATPLDLVAAEDTVFVASPTTDEVWVLPPSGAPYAVPGGDGPRALAVAGDAVVVAAQFERALLLLRAEAPREPARRVPLGVLGAQDVAVRDGVAYVTSNVCDCVVAAALDGSAPPRLASAGVNPRPVAAVAGLLVVGNQGSGDVSLVDASLRERRITPSPATEIAGGHTEKLQALVVGGKAPRDVVVSEKLGAAFVSSIGPNIGPNPERMEVSMNGGIGVVTLADARFARHVSTGRGVFEGLALDEARGVLYAADVATGRVVAFAAERLVTGGEAVLADLELSPPEGTALVRPAGDFGVKGRSGAALHSGPWALALAGDSLYVLNRFTTTVVELDVRRVRDGVLMRRGERRLPLATAQKERRHGEVVYYTDLGNSRMTCDTCHMDGHNEGVLFTKSSPMHFYRSPTLRGISESPPYFTPSKLPSLATTAEVVLGRNRYHNPDPTRAEVHSVAAYQDALALLPNPYAEADGAFPESLALPDGQRGDVARGRALFEARCTECHPPPHFTTDQDKSTRARFYDVGTPITLPIRETMQDAARYPVPAPSLAGAWDNFPLLHSGAAGFSVVAGDQLAPTHPFALRRVFELAAPEKHGGELAPLELDDLLAYLLTL